MTAVSFNAWTAEHGRVLEGFVKTVLNEIDPSILRRALRNQKALGWIRTLATFVAGAIGLSNAVDRVWDQVAADPRARNELRDLVEEAVEAWRSQTPELDGSRLLCVFVDDLDRCDPEVVLDVLEAMKLYLDVPGIVFILGYDEDIVSEVVLRDKGYGEEKARARGYLEKFIQISYRISRADEKQSEALISHLLEASGVRELLGETERLLVIERSGSNPRRIKRFINNFVLTHELDRRLREFDPQSLVRVLLLQMYFPQFTKLLERPASRDPLEEFLEYGAARDALLRRALGGSTGKVIEKAFKNHELAFNGSLGDQDPEELLRRLEQVVPVEFPSLATSDEFQTLAHSLAASFEWGLIRRELSRGALANVREPVVDDAPSWQRTSFAGLSIVWIDDNPQANTSLAATMIEAGAQVQTYSEILRLEAELRIREVDLLISDIGRGNDPLAGFQMLRKLRRDGEIKKPRAVIFFTSRITPMRIETAEELDAAITSDSEALLSYVASIAKKANAND